MEPDDATLARDAAGGDRRALEILLVRHTDRVHAICRRVVGDPDDALDATQEALLAIARGVGGFDGRAAFTTWLYRVATNAALDEVRRRSRRPRPSEIVDDVPDTGPGTDAVVTRLDLDAAFAQIPEEYRAAVALRDLHDLDYAQIAEVLEIPPGTVRSRIARGRAALAATLHQRLSEEPGNPETASNRPTPEP